MRFNAIMVTPVLALETGDVIAFEGAGEVVAGKVSALVYSSFELTPEQRDYMNHAGLEIPKQGMPLAGEGSSLLFFFNTATRKHDHAYLDHNVNVAVFNTVQKG